MSFGLDRYIKREKSTKQKEELEKEDEKETSRIVSSASQDDLERDWPFILEETVKSMVLYPHLLDYTRSNILPKQPTITPDELAVQLNVPLGVAIVLLRKLQGEPKETK